MISPSFAGSVPPSVFSESSQLKKLVPSSQVIPQLTDTLRGYFEQASEDLPVPLTKFFSSKKAKLLILGLLPSSAGLSGFPDSWIPD